MFFPITAFRRRVASLVTSPHALIPGAFILGLALLSSLWALHFTRIQNEKNLALQAAMESSRNIAIIVAINLEEVLGRSALYANLALVDPQSTSGSLIPRHVFAKQVGGSLENYFGQLGYTGSHVQSVNRVLGGQADAAFVGSPNLAALSDPASMRKIRVIWRSKAFPQDPFVYRGQLCNGLKDIY